MWRTSVVIFVGVACLACGVALGWGLAPGRQVITPERASAPTGGDTTATAPSERPRSSPPAIASAEAARLALAAASLAKAAPSLPLPPPPAPPKTTMKTPTTVEQLPPALQAVMRQVTQGREVRNLFIQPKTRDGHPVSELEFHLDGVEHELTLERDGKVVASEVDIEVSDIPAPVNKGIEAALAGAVVTEVERHQSGNTLFYEVQLQHQGDRYELDVSDEGRVLESKKR